MMENYIILKLKKNHFWKIIIIRFLNVETSYFYTIIVPLNWEEPPTMSSPE
jgi:hypothetical protein